MIAVVIEYQIRENVKTVRLPKRSAKWPRKIGPTNNPANIAKTNVPTPATP